MAETKKSWKTTTLGVVTLVAVVAGAAMQFLKGSMPDLTVLIDQVTAAITLIGGGSVAAGLMLARDNKVSDEEAGAGVK